MKKDEARALADGGEVAGIVVQAGRWAEERPRTVAFVWGRGVRSAPSLPYGRWKTAARSAA